MKYIVVFHYLDGGTFEVDVRPGDIDGFIAAIDKHEVYFNEETGAGVWIPIEKIRYFSIEKIGDDGERVRVCAENGNE